MENKEVFKELFTQLFKKAGDEIRSEVRKTRADHLADTIFQNTVSSKTFSRCYDKYVDDKHNAVGVPSLPRLNSYAQHLGYDFFSDFEKKYGGKKDAIESGTPEIEAPDLEAEKRWKQINQDENPKVVLSDPGLKKKAQK